MVTGQDRGERRMAGSPADRPDSADLIRVGFARRRDRFYRTVVWADLFGGVSLVREYGQLGRPGQMRLDAHGDQDSARKRMARLIREKERRGYRRIA
jgi:predicted DNA-binding WGR domain protein